MNSKADNILKDSLSSRQYDELCEKISTGVTATYKKLITPFCRQLLDNERIIGRIVDPEIDGFYENDSNWFKDPKNLTSFEIFQETSKLLSRIRNLKKVNTQAKDDLELLKLAKGTLDLDIGYRVVELIMKEEQ